jgi:arginine utilization regulatory protein
MIALSQCGLGAAVISKDGVILSINETGDHLLHGEGKLADKTLPEAAVPLCEESEEPVYANISFGEYLLRCPTPDVTDLPEQSRLLVFRDATADACHAMLTGVINQLSESVILCDGKDRVYLLNDAAVRLDSIVTRDVLGENISSIYQMQDGSSLALPQVISGKKPIVNVRQRYTTRYGKQVDIICNNYPITQNGQVLGGFSVMEDWSTIDDLHKQIIDLQEKLLERTSSDRNKVKSALTAKYTFRDIIYTSAAMKKVISLCMQVAKNDSSVMIYGETGTGKELFAQSIHNASRRADKPFLAINCAAIPENLLEGLLFGTEKGAYTGAERRAGLFEQANSGTLLLDEINSMNISLQSKLLRVLQDGMIRRVGGSAEIHVDVRVLSNINIPPEQAIAEDKLRRDLFYRLGVVNISVPPLRERREDIALLAKTFIMQYNKKMVKNIQDIDASTLDKFLAYPWPGNVRELQHAIEHAMNILPDNVSIITPEYIPDSILHAVPDRAVPISRPPQGPGSLNSAVQEMEVRTICKTLRESQGNISQAARALHMSRQNLQYRIKRYQIDLFSLLHNPDDT